MRLARRVETLAREAVDRDGFLRSLAEDVQKTLRGGVVALSHPNWPRPLMYVVDDGLAQRLSRPAVTDLLDTAGSQPIACTAAYQTDAPSESEPPDADAFARAIRIRLCDSPDPIRLIVVGGSGREDTLMLLADLRSLRVYRDCVTRLFAEHADPWAESIDHGVTDHAANAATHRASDRSGETGLTDLSNRASVPSPLMPNAWRGLQWLHRDLDLERTARRVANVARETLRCDRVCVLLPRVAGGKRYRVAAVSGVAIVDRRSLEIRSIEKLTGAAAVMRSVVRLPAGILDDPDDQREPLPPQIQTLAEDYLDQCDVGSATLLPLVNHPAAEDLLDPLAELEAMSGDDRYQDDGPIVAMLVCENFSTSEASFQRSNAKEMTIAGDAGVLGIDSVAVSSLATQASFALANASAHDAIFGRRLLAPLAHATRRGVWPWVLMASLLIAGTMFAAATIEVDHYVVATGHATPSLRREIFATHDGMVRQVHVAGGQKVRRDEPLFTLESPDLDTEREVLVGKLATLQERLSAIGAVRLSQEMTPERSGPLAVEQAELETERVGLKGQLELIDEQLDSLIIRSPIDGVVAGWNLERRLMGRPIQQGQALASVVDPAGRWTLELDIEDQHAGPVISTIERQTTSAVAFAIATTPDRTFAARLDELSVDAKRDAEGRYVLRAEATVVENTGGDAWSASNISADGGAWLTNQSVEPLDRTTLRTGAEVTAKIRCSRRSLAASWFFDVVNFYHRNIGFYLQAGSAPRSE